MAKFIYKGPDVSLGRFGNVRKGDVLEMTDHEINHIRRDPSDKRFEPFKEGKAPEPPGIKLPEGFDKMPKEEQDKIRAKLEREEQARRDSVEQANSKTEQEQLEQMTKEQLLGLVDKLRKEGKTIDVKADAPKRAIRKAIKLALYGDSRGDDEPETGEGEE